MNRVSSKLFPKLGNFNLKKKRRILRHKKNKMPTTYFSK